MSLTNVSVHLNATSEIAAMEVPGLAWLSIDDGQVSVFLGRDDFERVGNADRIVAALTELRQGAIRRLATDEATVIVRAQPRGLDSPAGAGELTVETSRG